MGGVRDGVGSERGSTCKERGLSERKEKVCQTTFLLQKNEIDLIPPCVR
jgi:hypothetical protein